MKTIVAQHGSYKQVWAMPTPLPRHSLSQLPVGAIGAIYRTTLDAELNNLKSDNLVVDEILKQKVRDELGGLEGIHFAE